LTADLLVVGSGLIGTSVALALAGVRDVLLTDTSPQALDEALARGAGRRWDGSEPARLALVCVPPRGVAPALVDLQRRGVAATLSHVASVQADVQRDIEARSGDLAGVCGSHPMSGREVSGPGAATADLFHGRAWLVCPSPATGAAAVRDVIGLARDCGADPVIAAPDEHDARVALVSHLPQVAASAVAARLVGAGPEVVRLAGPGLLDTTRIAASPVALWSELLQLNAGQVAPLVRALAEDLLAVAGALDALDAQPSAGALDTVADLVARGNQGRALLPVKRDSRDRDFATVVVDVPDRPGQLAGLFLAAAEADINVEDVRVDHLPGRPRGAIALLVGDTERDRLSQVLEQAGFRVVGRH
jgi:prephenate dehydrogenase